MALRDGMVPTLNGHRLVQDDNGFTFPDGHAVPEDQCGDIVFLNPLTSSDQHQVPPWWQHHDGEALGHILFDVPASQKQTSPQPAQATRPAIDVAALLGSIAHVQPAPSVKLNAAFFHFSLSSWLGLDPSLSALTNGAPPQEQQPQPQQSPAWDYAFWKAVVFEEDPSLEDTETIPPFPVVAASGDKVITRIFSAQIFRGDADDPETYRYWLAAGREGGVVQSGWLTPEPDLLDESRDHFSDHDDAESIDPALLRSLLAET